MASYPFVHILFWIAMHFAPHDVSQIVITAPDTNWTWTKQESGWIQSSDNSVWTVDGAAVTSNTGQKTDKQDVGDFVKALKEQDWSKSTSVKLGGMTSLTKVGDTFVYALNEGDSGEKRVIIEFRKKAPSAPVQ